MKIPKTFVPDNSEKKLEDMLKKEQENKLVKEVMLSNKKYDYYCDECGKFAGSIEILSGASKKSKKYGSKSSFYPWPFPPPPEKKSKKSEIIIESFLNTATLYKDNDYLEKIVGYLEKDDLKSVLREFSGNNLAFYCPKCDKCYCGNHWSTRIVWESGGWYDYTMGKCPKGHKRMIDD